MSTERGLTLEELSQRTGASAEHLNEWRSLGLFGAIAGQTFGPEDTERVCPRKFKGDPTRDRHHIVRLGNDRWAGMKVRNGDHHRLWRFIRYAYRLSRHNGRYRFVSAATLKCPAPRELANVV